MILQKSVKLLVSLEKEDYVTFTSDVQKLSTNDQDDLVCDLLTLLGGSFTTNASSDLENALETVCMISSPECRIFPMIDQAIDSKYESLTRILLQYISKDFKVLAQNVQERIQWDVVVNADREIVKEMKEIEQEKNDDGQLYASIDQRLMHWFTFCDLIHSTYCFFPSP
ncbi:hypothetical protein PRIPAC_86480 [Pristionchus pacificus]|nr:hypothetical protein PRIPAC_86480 [Pristionchus pacificus]